MMYFSGYCSRVAQTATDFADASHSKSAKSVTTTVSYGIFSSENAYPCTVTFSALTSAADLPEILELQPFYHILDPVCHHPAKKSYDRSRDHSCNYQKRQIIENACGFCNQHYCR